MLLSNLVINDQYCGSWYRCLLLFGYIWKKINIMTIHQGNDYILSYQVRSDVASFIPDLVERHDSWEGVGQLLTNSLDLRAKN